ncbi:DUF2087 domain-containing protein [Bacillus aquiflavi]|uniref:DUF2087 domain-containing protein n=1 Tax=Bacillus aquiflavi TaxID=2672567 RepID=A0A6B3VZN7_9BACI|nr:DUF2087 domain-containing protein [Bacillus aquiflavi]MBA4536678.1 DUF2087 domain-containing protein [Bacillus aquiflavi]NEY81046.1 DUF2087 domain-containing protein [Bacillus aquiflavi]UAC48714.1 DUF2087 domain-containing protein [Bacillus aquiflavi]
MANDDLFWNATVEELANGYAFDPVTEKYICLFCNKHFEAGIVYPVDNALYEARKAIIHHIEESHSSTFEQLLNMNKKYTGLSDHQKELLQYFKQGLNDKDIVKKLNVGSTSTIRNHRFKFKEKEKQAKIFLAIMMQLSKSAGKKKDKEEFIHFHKEAKMVDERYAITHEEREKILSTYFKQGLDGSLANFPSKEKRKIVILQHIISRFDSDKVYSEKEVNDILQPIYHDYATIRRYLIEYGFMKRNKECTQYWINKN